MKNKYSLMLAMPLCLLLLASTAQAAKLALVIGNDKYRNVAELNTAGADAKAFGMALEQAGYQVDFWRDLDEKTLKAALRDFKLKVAGGDQAVFFYSGHGVQLGAANYLLPVDITGDNEAQIKDEAIPLQRVLDDLQEQKAKFTLAVIDACRDNPFKGSGRALGGRGLGPTTAASGQMVIYSAGSGQQALDRLSDKDRSENGVFTRVFLEEMKQPGIPIDRVLKNVRQKVVELAKSVQHEQVPALYDQAVGEFYFYPPPGGVAAALPSPAPAVTQIEAPAGPRLVSSSGVSTMPPEKRRALDVLELIVEDIVKAQAGKEREKLQRELLDKSGKFVEQYPDEVEVWRMRAVVAMELDQADEGWQAGKRLKELGVEGLGDSETRKLMARLERKGWLGVVSPQEHRAAEAALVEMRRQQEEWQRQESLKAENERRQEEERQRQAAAKAEEERLQAEERQRLETAKVEEEKKAAIALHQEAVALFGKAGQLPDPAARTETLLASHRILEKILAAYPSAAVIPEVKETLRILDEQLSRQATVGSPPVASSHPEPAAEQ